MVIVETSVFTRRVLNILADEEYRQLQTALLNRPGMGVLIPGGGGLNPAGADCVRSGGRSPARESAGESA